jgi:hypothetical protein
MKGGGTVRAVLLERHVGPGSAVILYARAAWSDTKRAEFKAWAAGQGLAAGRLELAKLSSRSRSLSTCRDPMLAQEWAWGVWDEYVADVEAELGP